MDSDTRTAVEPYWIRARSYGRLAVRALGLGLVVLAAYNALLLPLVDVSVWAGYRSLLDATVLVGQADSAGTLHLGDVAAGAVGATVAYAV